MLIGAALLLAGCATAGDAGTPVAGRAADSAAQSGPARPPPGSGSTHPAYRNDLPEVPMTTALSARQIWPRLLEAAERGRITPDVVGHILGIPAQEAQPTRPVLILRTNGAPEIPVIFYYVQWSCADRRDWFTGLCEGPPFVLELLVSGRFGDMEGERETNCPINSEVIERLVAAGWVRDARDPPPDVGPYGHQPWPSPIQLHRAGGHILVDPADVWGPACVSSIRIFQAIEGR